MMARAAPLPEGNPAMSDSPVASMTPAAAHQALVVDDSAVDRQHMVNLLTRAGWDVQSASTGLEALQLAGQRPPDVIFMDIVMPGMDGYQACRRLAEDPSTRRIPVVFVSTKNQRADQVWARMQGGKALIGKPCTADQLQSALSQVYDRPD